MATLYDARQKITEAMQKAIYDIGTGGSLSFSSDNDASARRYAHSVGTVDGLKQALSIIEEMDKRE
jgi:hypothetical protein